MKTKLIILILTVLLTSLSAQNSNYTILISFDGFRWDYMDRGITPNLKKIEENGVRASSLIPVYPSKTFPNHYSIITGMYPENHGIIGNTMYDPVYDETYKINDANAVTNPRWYKAEAFWETAKNFGIITASYFWPGSELTLDYRRPDYFEKYDHYRPYLTRIDGVISWLNMPYNERPKFITLYFDAADSYGHRHGPTGIEIDSAITYLDEITGVLIEKIKLAGLSDSVNLIFVSDHGMTAVDRSKVINIDSVLAGFDYQVYITGSVMLIKPGINSEDKIIEHLRKNQRHFKTYRKSEVPDFYRFSKNTQIPEIVLVSALGWELTNDENYEGFLRWNSKGNHGYEKDMLDMHGFFLAMGPDFRKSYKTGSLRNIDIYPLLCEIFGIPIRSGIDGDLERIQFILSKYENRYFKSNAE